MARWLGWVDNAMAPRPRSGSRSVEAVVSHTSSVDRALTRHAAILASVAARRLDLLPRVRTGESQIHVQKRHLDRVVYLAEGPHGKAGSIGIELRHNILGGAVREIGG